MKKIDFHIHTIPKATGENFVFSLDTLKEYIKIARLDAIAITNHNFFVEDNNWFKLNKLYNEFIYKNKDKKLLLIELGLGFNTPGIIRLPFESMTSQFKNTTLIRVNNNDCNLTLELNNKVILVKNDCCQFINNLTSL